MSLEPLTHEEALDEILRLHALLEGKSQYVDCCCPGCPRKVPEAWAAGMCEPCAAEDCEHTDGARAVAAECDELRAEVEQLRAENEALGTALAAERDHLTEEALADAQARLTAVARENHRLAAVLAETEENVEAVARVLLEAVDGGAWETWDKDAQWVAMDEARAVLADRRARAKMEPTP
ncbi:MAG: hypothetical protein LC640_09035 [Frankia sp.]|nr:hypothetical protein [Frankia sp.]